MKSAICYSSPPHWRANWISTRNRRSIGTLMKFSKRFNYIERKVKESGKNFGDFTLDQLEQFWQEAKIIRLSSQGLYPSGETPDGALYGGNHETNIVSVIILTLLAVGCSYSQPHPEAYAIGGMFLPVDTVGNFEFRVRLESNVIAPADSGKTRSELTGTVDVTRLADSNESLASVMVKVIQVDSFCVTFEGIPKWRMLARRDTSRSIQVFC